MQLWSQNPFQHFPNAGDYLFWDCSTDAASYSHLIAFRPQQTTVTPENTNAIVMRLVCHMILSRLPDDALSEASESLADMYFFYKTPPALPGPHHVTSYPAKMGESVMRAPLHLGDE
jgi:hypothetical protein